MTVSYVNTASIGVTYSLSHKLVHIRLFSIYINILSRLAKYVKVRSSIMSRTFFPLGAFVTTSILRTKIY